MSAITSLISGHEVEVVTTALFIASEIIGRMKSLKGNSVSEYIQRFLWFIADNLLLKK